MVSNTQAESRRLAICSVFQSRKSASGVLTEIPYLRIRKYNNRMTLTFRNAIKSSEGPIIVLKMPRVTESGNRKTTIETNQLLDSECFWTDFGNFPVLETNGVVTIPISSANFTIIAS